MWSIIKVTVMVGVRIMFFVEYLFVLHDCQRLRILNYFEGYSISLKNQEPVPFTIPAKIAGRW
jgi:hypothetical protein